MAKKYFTADEDKYILDHYQSEDYRTIAKKLGRSICSVQHRAIRLGVKRRVTERTEFTPEEDNWLKEVMPNHLYRDVCKMFEQKFGKKLTKKQLDGHNYNVLKVSNSNKGNKKFRADKFEPIGYEVQYPNGYTYVKVSDTGNQKADYKSKQYVEYEKHYGPVPENCIVIFLDGDKNNFDADNLYALDKRLSCVLNKRGLRTDCNRDLTLAAIKTWELHYAVKDAKDV